jgi:hypothetical protein
LQWHQHRRPDRTTSIRSHRPKRPQGRTSRALSRRLKLSLSRLISISRTLARTNFQRLTRKDQALVNLAE